MKLAENDGAVVKYLNEQQFDLDGFDLSLCKRYEFHMIVSNVCSNEYIQQAKGYGMPKTTKTGTTIVGLCYKVQS